MIKTYIINTEKRNEVKIIKSENGLVLVQWKGSTIQRWVKSSELITKGK